MRITHCKSIAVFCNRMCRTLQKTDELVESLEQLHWRTWRQHKNSARFLKSANTKSLPLTTLPTSSSCRSPTPYLISLAETKACAPPGVNRWGLSSSLRTSSSFPLAISLPRTAYPSSKYELVSPLQSVSGKPPLSAAPLSFSRRTPSPYPMPWHT